MIVPSMSIRDLGVMVYVDLTLTAHVSHLSSSCSISYVQLRAIRRSLSTDTAHALVDSTTATECLPECRNTTSIGYNLCFDRLLVSHCDCQAPPVWLIWCDVNSTGFQFGKGYPTICARWHTNACTTLRRRIWLNCVFLWLLFLDVCSYDRLPGEISWCSLHEPKLLVHVVFNRVHQNVSLHSLYHLWYRLWRLTFWWTLLSELSCMLLLNIHIWGTWLLPARGVPCTRSAHIFLCLVLRARLK